MSRMSQFLTEWLQSDMKNYFKQLKVEGGRGMCCRLVFEASDISNN